MMYYSFYKDGNKYRPGGTPAVELKGLNPNVEYRIEDYVNGRVLAENIPGDQAVFTETFSNYLLLRAIPLNDEPIETPTPEPTPAPADVSDVFPDIKHGAWYEPGIQYVYDHGFMSGNNGLFSPTSDITRAQLVTTLYRLSGKPTITDTAAVSEFSDIAEGTYYTDAVCWAYTNGITTGSNGKFDPTGKLTRQQMAAFFFRYADYAGLDTVVRGDISSMLNADKVSTYAKEPIEWAVGTGLISGSDVTVNGIKKKDLNPKGNTTRAQVATILMRFCEEQ